MHLGFSRHHRLPAMVLLGLVVACGEPASGPSTQPPSTSLPTAPSSRPATDDPTTPTTIPPDGIQPGVDPAALSSVTELVIASDDGIFLTTGEDGAPIRRLWDQPTAVAFMVGEDLVVAQGSTVSDMYPRPGDGPLLVFDPSGVRSLPIGDEILTLHDAGLIAGHPVAVATSRMGETPDDTEERLLLVDLETDERTDLGQVGGWEWGVDRARIVGEMLILLTANEAEQHIEGWRPDGTAIWSLPVSSEARFSLAASGDELVLLRPRFADLQFTPLLEVSRHASADGAPLGETSLAFTSDEVVIDGGYCFSVEYLGEDLLCDQTYGGPLRLTSSGTVTYLVDLDRGVPTVPRRPS